MTRTSKGFTYVFNTPRKDRKVARVLSGWAADEAPTTLDVAVLDSGAQERLTRLQELLFASCVGLNDSRLNVSRRVIGVLTAYLVRHFSEVKTLEPRSLFVLRVEECLEEADISLTDLLAWSVALNHVASRPAQQSMSPEQKNCCNRTECHHAAVINELIESNRLLSARLLVLEAAILKRHAPEHPAQTTQHEQVSSAQTPASKRRKKAATNLSSLWFEWYTRQLRVWSSSDRQKKSYYRLIVVYMKLFLEGGFQLHERPADYKDRVLEVGQRAKSAVLEFLSGHGIRAKGGGSVLREMRKLHRLGALDDRITTYRTYLTADKIADLRLHQPKTYFNS